MQPAQQCCAAAVLSCCSSRHRQPQQSSSAIVAGSREGDSTYPGGVVVVVCLMIYIYVQRTLLLSLLCCGAKWYAVFSYAFIRHQVGTRCHILVQKIVRTSTISYVLCVRYYALADYLHVLKLIGSDCTAFGICCTAFLFNGYFETRTSKVGYWPQLFVRLPWDCDVHRLLFSWLGRLALPSGSTALTQDERYRRYIIDINLL